MKYALTLMLALTPVLLTACSKDRPCVICYEDEWSREPFPGQPKQHIKPLSPEDLKGRTLPPAIHNEFVDTVSASVPQIERW